jgi:diguanylate cyclase
MAFRIRVKPPPVPWRGAGGPGPDRAFNEDEPMSRQVTAEQLETCARSANEMMTRLGIPATPPNYEIWYTYFADTDRALTDALNEMLDKGIAFTPERTNEILTRFFKQDQDRAAISEITQTTHRIEQTLGRVLDCVGDARKTQGEYGQSLERYSSEIRDQGAADEIAALVQSILEETLEVAGKTRSLEGRLDQSSEEIGELKRSLAEAQRETMTDALTGIGNRKYFDLRLRDAMRHAKEEGERLSMLMVDIDHFKVFNDTFGHTIGDEVLKIVARSLAESVKGRDTPARYGGEEFAVLLPQTSLPNAVTLAEQIRKGLASRRLRNRRTGEDFGNVTVSIGVAQFVFGESPEAFVDRADQALYRAKSTGRDKVVDETGLNLAQIMRD